MILRICSFIQMGPLPAEIWRHIDF